MTQWHKDRQHWDTEPSHRFHHQETRTSSTVKKTIYIMLTAVRWHSYTNRPGPLHLCTWRRDGEEMYDYFFTWVLWKARKELVLEMTVENFLEVWQSKPLVGTVTFWAYFSETSFTRPCGQSHLLTKHSIKLKKSVFLLWYLCQFDDSDVSRFTMRPGMLIQTVRVLGYVNTCKTEKSFPDCAKTTQKKPLII